MRNHVSTYAGFTKMATYGLIGVVTVLILLGILVA
jgi:hypothetical protein